LKRLEKEPGMCRSNMERELPATKERLDGVMESIISQMEVVMETPIGKQAIEFWELTEASLDGKREGERMKP
jgi:hypothetical protein